MFENQGNSKYQRSIGMFVLRLRITVAVSHCTVLHFERNLKLMGAHDWNYVRLDRRITKLAVHAKQSLPVLVAVRCTACTTPTVQSGRSTR